MTKSLCSGVLATPILMFMSLALAGPDLQTEAARWQSLPLEQVMDGRVEAVRQATVSAQTSGRVEAVYFDVDDFVEAGALIVQLRDTEHRSRLDQAEATLSETRARHAEARSEYERIRGIFEKQLISRADMDRAAAALRAAEARMEGAQAARSAALEALQYTRVTAPHAGIVTERHVEPGESVNPGQVLMSGISLDRLRVATHIPQRFMDAVRQHRQLRIRLPDGAWVQASGMTLFPFADAGAAVFRVRADVPEGTPGLFPGMFLKVAFLIGERQALLVPVAAVFQRSEVSAVYVVDEDGGIFMRQVRVGERVDERYLEILAGLEAGERVALDPLQAAVLLRTRAGGR